MQVTSRFLRYFRVDGGTRPRADCGREAATAIAAAPGTRSGFLLGLREMPAAILLPAGFVGLGAERLLLAVTNGFDATDVDPGCGQRVLDGIGTPVTQSEVVLGRSALIAVAFDGDLDI